MKITWWGTAGFEIRTDDTVLLIDPYLTRNPKARPAQPLRPTDVPRANHIFITHGHFDHLADVPALAGKTGTSVHLDPVAASTLRRLGVDPGQLNLIDRDGQAVTGDAWRAQAFFSRHVRFDRTLILRTIWRAQWRLWPMRKIMRDFPAGQVLSWRLNVEGRTIHHFGSAGSTAEELRHLADQPLDLLLVPLQGHTRIHELAMEYVRILRPRLVIPHHQDDFYPPISQQVDPEPFLSAIRRECPDTQTRVLAMNETMEW